MNLVNEGTIGATGTNALVLDTGSNIIENSGILEATGSGGLVVKAPVDNSGLLSANGGNLTVEGTVSGNGNAAISGAANLEFDAASNAATAFAAGANGMLSLKDSADFTGTVAGFAPGDAIDFADIGFGANATLGYTSKSDNSGGTLSVSDGTHTANIALLGMYMASTFVASGDSNGGTLITVSQPPEQNPTLTQPHG